VNRFSSDHLNYEFTSFYEWLDTFYLNVLDGIKKQQKIKGPVYGALLKNHQRIY